MEKREKHHLPQDTILEGRYVLQDVSGEGNFGITYTGWDKLLESRVAIKEFFPVNRVTRDVTNGDYNVCVFQKDNYEEILHKYLEEAKRLSKLNQVEGIVSIRDFFYANNTAYIIMEYIEGISIKEYVMCHGKMAETEIKNRILPIMDALEKVHENGIIHRDISPDNIMITSDEKVVLVDFGSARQVNIQDDKSVTVIIKRGYSSPELYRSRGEQGPWSDVYAICATIYYMMTGEVPDEAIDRILGDETPSLIKIKGIKASLCFKKAVMKGISLKQQERYRTITELKQDLYQEEEKKHKIFAAVGICIFCIMATCGVGNMFHATTKPTNSSIKNKLVLPPEPTPEVFTMISCVGMTKKEIEKLLPGQEALTIRWEKAYSSKVKKGRVLRQSISQGTTYQIGDKQILIITMSKGPEKTMVPNVVGMNYKSAKKMLQKKHWKVKVVWRESDNDTGQVIDQSKAAGKKVVKGKSITLYVSRKRVKNKNDDSYDGIII